MTVETLAAFKEYTGDGLTVEFQFNFPSFQESWIYGLIDRVVMTGLVSLNVDQKNSPGGMFTFDSPPSSGSEVVILREADLLQETDYPEYTRFPAKDHEEALDKLTMICQQLDFHVDLLKEDTTGHVFRAGDVMEGQLHLLPTEAEPSTVATRKDYVDTANSILFNKMALKTVTVISSDQQTLQVTAPTLADDITLTPRTNVGNGLVKLLPSGIIPSAHLPDVGGGALTFLGLLDASLGNLPPDGTEMGDAYLVSIPGTLLLRNPSNGIEESTDLDQNDTLIWYEADNKAGLPEGWYFYDTGKGEIVITADDVTLDETGLPITAANVQEGFEDLLNNYLSNYANAVFNGDSPTFVSASVSASLNMLNSTQGNISLIQAIDGVNRRVLSLYGGSSTGTGAYVYLGATTDTVLPDTINFGIPSGIKMKVDSDGVTVNDIIVENVLNFPNPFEAENSGRMFSAGSSDRHYSVWQSGLSASKGAYITVYGENDSSFPNSITFSTPTGQPLRLTTNEVFVRDESNAERKAGWKPGQADATTSITINNTHILQTLLVQTAGAKVVTIPPGFGSVGDIIQMVTESDATIDLTPGAGVVLEWVKGGELATGSRVVTTDSVFTLYCAGASRWKVWGVGIS